MKFLCTKVKPSWLTSSQNKSKVEEHGLKIIDSLIGIEIKGESPDATEIKTISIAIDNLFKSHKAAFPVRVIEI